MNYQDFPTYRFSTGTENTGAAFIAPVFLLVEPSPILRSRFREWLEDVLSDPRILVAANGAEALRLAAQEQPSHLLMEMDLADTTGFEVLRQMRQGLPVARIIATGWY